MNTAGCTLQVSTKMSQDLASRICNREDLIFSRALQRRRCHVPSVLYCPGIMRNRLPLILFVLVLAASVLGGLVGDRVRAGSSTREAEKLILRFSEVLALIESSHAREVSPETMVENAIQGLLRTLDPHSSFFATPDYSRLQEEQRGKYYGLGITIRAEAPGSGRVLVVEPPVPGTPAYRAGMKAGDVISEISGEPIEDWDVNEDVIPQLKGPRGTTVDITVERAGETQPLHFAIERDEIPLYTIKYAFQVQPGVAYVRIDKFSETTRAELDKALRDLRQAKTEALILDLRSNPGGALRAAIEVADRFLEKDQVVVSTRSRDQSENRPFIATRGSREKYPMIVLIDENSASASEIVAGALQDHGRALIVGQTSFGKALVQTIYPLDGGKRGLALTTGKYYTPNDRLIQRDYSDGFYNYFYRPRRTARIGEEGHPEKGEEGGIEPDEFVSSEPSSRLLRDIARRDLFFNFARRLWTQEIETGIPFERVPDDYTSLPSLEKERLLGDTRISPEVLEEFRLYLLEQELEFEQQEFEEDADILTNHIQQRIYLKLFGDREGYRISLDIDRQVQRALDLLPRARSLVQKSLASR